MGEKRR